MASSGVRVSIFDRISNWVKFKKHMKELDKYGVEVGVFGADSFIQMIANVHEYGLTIKPKGQFLTIPTAAAGDRGARDFGKELFRPKGKKILAVAKPDGTLEVMFYLVESVTIPERSFIRSTFDEKKREWDRYFEKLMEELLLKYKATPKQLYDRLGARMVADVQAKITALHNPPNAHATKKRKGSTNPLVDTGKLRQAITYRVVRK
ncbi:hypothetical protein [Paenibacillus periandrae]|uniref:hypothetical protein n=1 Tax=Paenibacillus periandrae TaxID=1761741 RepID=UPI001F09298D|nr:hypothetical protein [Paenibacillus periandrae]